MGRDLTGENGRSSPEMVNSRGNFTGRAGRDRVFKSSHMAGDFRGRR